MKHKTKNSNSDGEIVFFLILDRNLTTKVPSVILFNGESLGLSIKKALEAVSKDNIVFSGHISDADKNIFAELGWSMITMDQLR